MNWTKSKATKQSSIKTIVSGRVYAKTRVEGFTKGTFVPLYSETVNQMARITYYALSDSDTKSSLIAADLSFLSDVHNGIPANCDEAKRCTSTKPIPIPIN